jgi:hypothetical protein
MRNDNHPPSRPDGEDEQALRPPSRRSFLRTLAAGAAVLVPALRPLMQPTPALADPPHSHCAKVYIKLLYQKCVGTRMIGYYEARCSVCWYVCYTFTDDHGPCPQ